MVKQAGKIIITAGQFAGCPTLNETPGKYKLAYHVYVD